MCAEIVLALDLAAHTGLRLGDLVRLSWSHIGEDTIVITTGKNHKREAIIPLYDALRNVLKQLPKRSTTILTNRRHQPWRAKLFASAFVRAKRVAGMSERDLHLHDLRGTAATKFYTTGLSERVIAEIMGWRRNTLPESSDAMSAERRQRGATIRQINQAKRFDEER